MNAALKHIRVKNGITTKVYRYYNDTHCMRVEVSQNELAPVIFRNVWNVDGRLVNKHDVRHINNFKYIVSWGCRI